MKFGIFTHVPWPEGSDPRQVFEDATEEVVHAEELGYHSAWLAEHHFSRYGIGSSLPALAGSLAARTETIRLGTAVLVPPLHNPITLAEDTATLDVISGGRLDVGFGRGTAGYEYTGYNVDREESQGRFQESIAVIKGLWTTPEFSHQGNFYQVTRANLTPPPLQRPHPPIYLAATRTEETLEYAATTGHPLMIGVVLDTSDSVALCHRYVHLSKEAGHNVSIAEIPFFRYVYVAETEEQARKEAEPGLSWTMDMIQWRRSFTESSEVYQRLDEWRSNRDELPTSCEYLYENRAVVGSPEQCVAQIKALQEQGIEYFGCNLSFGGLEHRLQMRSLELFAKEVMPHFA
jgi:alkanesulfonate monooxygenase SsuD/methylene tetrahydromethanopterin reductase-like flavin-dependent oxidoreductase (luciferase family)